MLISGISPPFMGSASKSAAALLRRDPGYTIRAAVAGGESFAPLINENCGWGKEYPEKESLALQVEG